ncbi:hypothetical protein EDD37DRAFT_370784 [Exophiala viscosa]|uniref:uncharacterized protein n=1 Tax=Exophiala viscosa TaxID=2486360 RepID=UPI00219DCECE|nr:hypothetical protein EDD37DRAFT_370784 [Exophiala viscosa]
MRPRLRGQTALAISLSGLIQVSIASISFSDLQPISGFPSLCTKAYGTLIDSCQVSDFPGVGGTGSCSVNCEIALETVQIIVRRACYGEEAPADSLIGQLFIGNVVAFLCDQPSAATTSTAGSGATSQTIYTDTMTFATSTSTQATVSMATSSNTASNTASSTASTNSQTTAGSASTTSSSETTSSTDTNTSKSLSTSISTSRLNSSATSLQTSTSTKTTTHTSKSSTTTSSSHASTSTQSSSGNGGESGDGGSGGGSPFDSQFSSGAAPSIALQAQMLFLSLLVLMITL